MLVLSRHPGEQLRINDNILITILQSAGGNTRLGIDAPKDVKVLREEVYRRIKREQEANQ